MSLRSRLDRLERKSPRPIPPTPLDVMTGHASYDALPENRKAEVDRFFEITDDEIRSVQIRLEQMKEATLNADGAGGTNGK